MSNTIVAQNADKSRSELVGYITSGMVLVPMNEQGTPARKHWNLLENCISTEEGLNGHTGNFALAHAFSGTCALDLDDLEKAKVWFKERGISLGELLADKSVVQISSGRENRAKLLFRLPEGVAPLQSRAMVANGVEFSCGDSKGNTNQDTLPPSLHRKMGKPYQWIGDWHNLPTLPKSILELWQSLLARPKPKPLPETKNPETVTLVRAALAAISPDVERKDWLKVGFALHSANEGWFSLWDEWSKSSPKYNESEMQSSWSAFHADGGVNLGTLFHIAREAGWSPYFSVQQTLDMMDVDKMGKEAFLKKAAALARVTGVTDIGMEELAGYLKKRTKLGIGLCRKVLAATSTESAHEQDDAPQYDMAEMWLNESENEDGAAPISSGGLFRAIGNLWKQQDPEKFLAVLGRRFREQRHAQRMSDCRGIAGFIQGISKVPDFFAKAPRGVPNRGEFWGVSKDGRVKREPLTVAHRQTFELDLDIGPGPTPLWHHFLVSSFMEAPTYEDGADASEVKAPEFDDLGIDPSETEFFDYDSIPQAAMLEELMGLMLIGALNDYKVSGFGFGPRHCGKSELVKLMKALLGEGNTSSLPLEKFEKDTSLWDLLGKVANFTTEVGERAVGMTNWKNIVGGDEVTVKCLYVNETTVYLPCGLWVFANRTFALKEKDKSVFERMRIIQWHRTVEKENWIKDLGKRIVAEEGGALVYRLLQAAARAVKRGYVATTPEHDRMVKLWEGHNNTVLGFVGDKDYFEVEKDWSAWHKAPERWVQRDVLYEQYKAWVKGNGHQYPVSRRTFIQELELHGVLKPNVRGQMPAGSEPTKKSTGLILGGLDVWVERPRVIQHLLWVDPKNRPSIVMRIDTDAF